MQNGQVSVFLTRSDRRKPWNLTVHFDCWRQRRKLKQPLYLYFCMLYPITSGRFVRIFSSFQNSFSSNKHKEPFIWVRLQTNTNARNWTQFSRWPKCNSSKWTTSSHFVGRQVKISKLIETTLRSLPPHQYKNTIYIDITTHTYRKPGSLICKLKKLEILEPKRLKRFSPLPSYKTTVLRNNCLFFANSTSSSNSKRVDSVYKCILLTVEFHHQIDLGHRPLWHDPGQFLMISL